MVTQAAAAAFARREYAFDVFICRIARKLPLVCTLQRFIVVAISAAAAAAVACDVM